MNISAYYDEIAHCNRCGFCQTACPIFRSTGHESGVARGRLALLRAIIEDRLDWSRELEEPLFDCLLCGACTANCFPAIPTSDLMVRARNEYLEKVGRKSIHRLLFDHLLPYPRRLHLAARAVAVGKNAKLTDVARALGLLRMFGRDFTAITDIIDQFPERPFRDKNRPGEYRGEGHNLRIAYFVGCGVDIIQQEGAAATLALLKKIGRSVAVLDNCCCGLPAQSYGDLEVARKLASKNLETLSNRTADVIVTDCSSCTSFLKKYPDLFEADDPQKAKAKKVAAKVRDLVEFVADVSLPKLTSTRDLRVTYHDPCHASRGQKISREPREILKSIQGVTYVELPEADWCCGGAGAYAVSHQELAGKVLDRKMENVKKTAADLLLTSCPACMIQLAQGVRKHGLSTRVGHISQIMNGLESL